MATDWLFRIGDGNNFVNSSPYKVWGIQGTQPMGKHFIKHGKPGDRLWFIKSKSKGLAIAVATYVGFNARELGPLISLSYTNEELGWNDNATKWISDIEVHYDNLYWLENCEIITEINGPSTIRKYDEEKCKVNLDMEYKNILKYSKVRHFM